MTSNDESREQKLSPFPDRGHADMPREWSAAERQFSLWLWQVVDRSCPAPAVARYKNWACTNMTAIELRHRQVREPAMYLFQYRHQYQYLYRPSVSPVFVRSVFVRSVLAQYSSTLHSVFVRLVDLEQLRVINKLRVRLDGLDC